MMNSHPISNLLTGMAFGAALAAVVMVITNKNATQKAKKIAETTADNVSTMFKMD